MWILLYYNFSIIPYHSYRGHINIVIVIIIYSYNNYIKKINDYKSFLDTVSFYYVVSFLIITSMKTVVCYGFLIETILILLSVKIMFYYLTLSICLWIYEPVLISVVLPNVCLVFWLSTSAITVITAL